MTKELSKKDYKEVLAEITKITLIPIAIGTQRIDI
jgi:hypothetical protein